MKHLLILAACLAPTPALAEVFDCTVRSIEEWRGDVPNGMNDGLAKAGTFHFTLDTETGALQPYDGASPMGDMATYIIREAGETPATQLIATEESESDIVVRIDRRTMTFGQLNPVSALSGDCVIQP